MNLCSRAKKWRADDMGRYYRVPADDRDLNYNKLLRRRRDPVSSLETHLHNTDRLDIGRSRPC